MGFSIILAWPRIVTAEAPINQRIVEIGEAKNPRGMAIIIKPVYSCEDVKVTTPRFKSLPCKQPIPYMPTTTRIITKSNRMLVTRL